MKQIMFLIFIFSFAAPDFAYCQSSLNKKTDLRLQRLNTFAEIWGDLAIHHPLLMGKENEWDSILTAAIPQIEKAKTTEDFVAALNNSLFAYINDPTAH